MPSRLDPRVRSLVLRLPLAVLLALVLWYGLLAGPYGRALVAAAEGLSRFLERPAVTHLEMDGGNVVVERSDFHSRSQLPAFALSPITANLVLLLTLLFATPKGLRERSFAFPVAALAALFASHLLHLVLAVQTIYATNLGTYSELAFRRWQRELLATTRYFLDIVGKYALPFVFWAFTLRLGGDEQDAAEGTPEAGARPFRPRKRRKGRG